MHAQRPHVIATTFAQRRARLLVALAIGVAVAGLVPDALRPSARFLVGWNAAVWSYLALIAGVLARTTPERVRSVSEREDPGAAAVLALLSLTAVASLVAIVLELAAVRTLPVGGRLLHYALTGATVFGSWLMVNTLFTFHYAHLYYRARPDLRPLRFPSHQGDEVHPDYWDFLYFSFTVAVAAQTSDVSVVGRGTRQTVLAQSVLSFVFNAAIIGLSINVAAGLIGG